ncbi:MAG: polyphosphate kinase 1 [Candidatus Electrothrix aestuarii]|uniref:Polyphosphate kinase n=1 Tax=Candidatus Electrothrix aestuarii TaxID=3062594 RepID=A0AAU8LQW2_9BACT|nr:polyphosphate kinase 1 [Candidatus Electrothrix aestuarii]
MNTESEVEAVESREKKSSAQGGSKGRPEFDLTSPEWYLNRELTWLEFNRRVLHEGQDERTPLLERIMFLAIMGGNLDEFFMKRIGGLKQQVGAGVRKLTVDGRTPGEQIGECHEVVRSILTQKERLEQELFSTLSEKGIRIVGYQELDKEQQQEVDNYFLENIYPLLTPQGMDPAHPFPFISNLSINLLVVTRYEHDAHPFLNRIKVPTGVGIPRFIRVGGGHLYIRFEDLIANNLAVVFPGLVVESCSFFRVTRNAITEQDGANANDLLAVIETALRNRKFAEIVRLEVDAKMSAAHRGMLAAELGIDEDKDVFTVEGIIGKRDLFEIAAIDLPEFHYPLHQPLDHFRLSGDSPNIFHLIREKGSLLFQHPYESFDSTVQRFLREASRDPKVLAIKMTLYRTSAGSRIIPYLLDAAQNGKQVAVVVELMARFDESANIRWAENLEEAGVHVTYGVVGLKTHSKVIFVVRRDFDGLRRYAHIGTGNYHAGTARIYSDLGLLTSDRVIAKDLTELFNYLTTGYAPERNYRKLLPSPRVLKKALLEKIEREIANHSNKNPGRIQFKTNALEDKDITAALYKASMAGVQVDLLIRDTCRLRPGVPGLSENVRVISIVGRFLEHSRIYYFYNNGEEEYFIGSADIMKRNLEDRVEVITPVEQEELRKVLREVLDVQLSDQRSAWEMQSDGRYIQRTSTGENEKGSHEILIEKAEKRLSDAQALFRLEQGRMMKRKKGQRKK